MKRHRDQSKSQHISAAQLEIQTEQNHVFSGAPRLQFSPQPTLEAAHAVHNPGDVKEGQPEVILVLNQQLRQKCKRHSEL